MLSYHRWFAHHSLRTNVQAQSPNNLKISDAWYWPFEVWVLSQVLSLGWVPYEQLTSLKIIQVKEVSHTQRPLQDIQWTQVVQVLFKSSTSFSDRLCGEVTPQLFSYRNSTSSFPGEHQDYKMENVNNNLRGKQMPAIWSPWLRRSVAWRRWKSEYRLVMTAGVLSLPPDWHTWMV